MRSEFFRLKEFRCCGCNKLLGKYSGEVKIEIKCPRCNKLNILIEAPEAPAP